MRRRRFSAAVLSCVLAPAAGGCGGTGGERVRLDLAVEGVGLSAEGSFTTETGWEVRLERAVIALGPVYLWENPPPVAGVVAPRRAPWRALGDFLVPPAHAHVGDTHFDGGQVRAEYVGQVLFDAVAEQPLELGSIEGIAGRARSFTVVLDPPRQSVDDGRLEGHHAVVVGEASRGGEVVAFSGGLDVPAEGTQRQVDGIEADVSIQEGGRLLLRVDVSRWLRDAEFQHLTEGGSDSGFVITPASQVRTAWFIGLRSFDAFSLIDAR